MKKEIWQSLLAIRIFILLPFVGGFLILAIYVSLWAAAIYAALCIFLLYLVRQERPDPRGKHSEISNSILVFLDTRKRDLLIRGESTEQIDFTIERFWKVHHWCDSYIVPGRKENCKWCGQE